MSRWGFPSFHFLIYNINSTSHPKLTYSNISLRTYASFNFLIYDINVTFSPTLTYFNLFHFTTAFFHFLIYNLNITFYPTLTNSNLFLFTTAFLTPIWYVRIKIWIGGITCCSTCLGCLIHKTGFFGIRLRRSLLSFVYGLFSLFSVFQFPLHYDSSIDLSWLYLSKDIFHVNIIHPDNWTFVAWNQRKFSYDLLHHNFEPQYHFPPDY